MTRQALQTFEYTPIGRNLATTVKPKVLGCHKDLQHLFDRLDNYREGLSFTGIRNLWSRVLWTALDGRELSLIKDKLAKHQTALREFLAALNSYV